MRITRTTATARTAAVAAAAALTLGLAACAGDDDAASDAPEATVSAGDSTDGAPADGAAPAPSAPAQGTSSSTAPAPAAPGHPAAPAAATDEGAAADAGRLAEVSRAVLDLPGVSEQTKSIAGRATGIAERIQGVLGHADPAAGTLRDEDLARVTGGEGVHADLDYLKLLHAALPPLLDRVEASGAEGAQPIVDEGRALMQEVDGRLGV
ncbi:hypothetical protein [Corynebacterium sp. 335C]